MYKRKKIESSGGTKRSLNLIRLKQRTLTILRAASSSLGQASEGTFRGFLKIFLPVTTSSSTLKCLETWEKGTLACGKMSACCSEKPEENGWVPSNAEECGWVSSNAEDSGWVPPTAEEWVTSGEDLREPVEGGLADECWEGGLLSWVDPSGGL